MRYVEARIDKYQREEAYRIYTTRSLQLAPQNKYIKSSFSDIINKKNIDNKSGDEIALDIFSKAGLKFEE